MLDNEHNMFKMGGLWKKMPVVFWTFLIGACALSALPLITAGFYSKDEIIWQAYASDKGSITLWLTGLAGAFITALYTFRMVILTFFGKAKAEPAYRPGIAMTVPLVVLAFLSFAGGFIQLPNNMGHVTLFSQFIQHTLPVTVATASGHAAEWIAQVIAAIVSIAGLVLAYRIYYNKPFPAAEPVRSPIQRFFFQGWDFDQLYDKGIVQPIVFLSRIDKNDIIDRFYTGLASIAGLFNRGLAATQNGKLRWYAMALGIGAVITLTILLYT